jgi:hypothetical protein
MKPRAKYNEGELVYNTVQPGYYRITGMVEDKYYLATRVAEADCELVLDERQHVLGKQSTTDAAVHALCELSVLQRRVDQLIQLGEGVDDDNMPVTLEELIKRNEVQQQPK